MQHCHSFHDCPLRSSSLLIISKEKQTIVTATDEVFNMLGYEPTQLIGRSIDILHLRPIVSLGANSCFMLRHESCGDVPFEICSHFDPLANATDLEYWLIRPVHTLSSPIGNATTPAASASAATTTIKGPVTILRLSPFGTIEHAYPSSEFPQMPHELKGHPIMSFVYKSDVRFLCEKLSKIRRRAYATFKIRWLKQHPRDGNDFEWVAFTVMNSPRRLSCASANDPQTRPTCIIRPIYNHNNLEESSQTQQEMIIDESMWDTLWMPPIRSSINAMYQAIETLQAAIDEGRSYLVQFLAHMITHFFKVSSELMYYAALEFEEYLTHSTKDGNNSRKDQAAFTNVESKKGNKCVSTNGSSSSNSKSIKVTLDNCIWTVPLLINNSFTQQYQQTKKLHGSNNNKSNQIKRSCMNKKNPKNA